MKYDALVNAVITGQIDQAKTLTMQAIGGGAGAQDILDESLIPAMDIVGDKFAQGAVFVPQMLRSAKTMQECVVLLKPYFHDGGMATKGKVILGTVKGDLHDIGKNIVAMMLEGAGFQIIDLGVDVAPATFVKAALEQEADILGMSALLSTTMPEMTETMKVLKNAGRPRDLKIMIGGAPVTAEFATRIGADCYAPDACTAVAESKKLLQIQ